MGMLRLHDFSFFALAAAVAAGLASSGCAKLNGSATASKGTSLGTDAGSSSIQDGKNGRKVIACRVTCALEHAVFRDGSPDTKLLDYCVDPKPSDAVDDLRASSNLIAEGITQDGRIKRVPCTSDICTAAEGADVCNIDRFQAAADASADAGLRVPGPDVCRLECRGATDLYVTDYRNDIDSCLPPAIGFFVARPGFIAPVAVGYRLDGVLHEVSCDEHPEVCIRGIDGVDACDGENFHDAVGLQRID